MRRIAVINQKGGVGKTTTTVNLGAALARLGRRVLVCDLDPQANLTVHFDVDPAAEGGSVYELLHGKARLAEVVRPTRQPGLDLAAASIDLAGIELELVNTVGRETVLRDAFREAEATDPARWDDVLVDCPPSLGLLSLNALVACDEILVPIQAEFFALQGLGKLIEIVELVQRRLNPALRIAAMVSCRHDPSTNLGRQVLDDISLHFGKVLLKTVIRRNVKLAEAPSHGKTIFEYDEACRGAQDYLALARELLAMRESGVPAAPAPAVAPPENPPLPASRAPSESPAAESPARAVATRAPGRSPKHAEAPGPAEAPATAGLPASRGRGRRAPPPAPPVAAAIVTSTSRRTTPASSRSEPPDPE